MTFSFSVNEDGKLKAVNFPEKAELKMPTTETENETFQGSRKVTMTFELTGWQAHQVQMALFTVPIWENDANSSENL